MWDVLLKYIIPGGVSLYGVFVLMTGEIGDFWSQAKRGTLVRILGLVLLAALPLALALGPHVRIQAFAPIPKLDVQMREAEITRDILEQHRQLSAWVKMNEPKDGRTTKDDEDRIEKIKERTRALEEFNVQFKSKSAETDARIQELKDEQARLRQDREAANEQQREAAARNGPMWVAVGILITVWAIAWLFGKPVSPKVVAGKN